MRIVYHPGLIFGSKFVNRFHPFEFDRAERALAQLRKILGAELDALLLSPHKSVELSDLTSIHDREYLDSLLKGSTIAQVVEVPLLGICPKSWLERWFLKPALWSLSCSLLAAETALQEGFCLSLGGGFHHAKRRGGEGFCLLNDVAYIIETLRARKGWGSEEKFLYLDLDVHQGNGVSDYYQDDPGVCLMDLYNNELYPVYGERLPEAWARPLPMGCDNDNYLEELAESLRKLVFEPGAKLLIYNAGTDVFEEDRLGGFKLTKEGVLARDIAVMRAARMAEVPLLVLASGGYSHASAELLANCALAAVREYRD